MLFGLVVRYMGWYHSRDGGRPGSMDWVSLTWGVPSRGLQYLGTYVGHLVYRKRTR